jgi:hypothetical protein
VNRAVNDHVSKDWQPDKEWGYEIKGQLFRQIQQFPESQNGRSRREIKRRERTRRASETYREFLVEKGKMNL